MSGISESLNRAFDYHIYNVSTSIPCRIINVKNIGQQRVDVQPLINLITPEGEYKEHPAILSVPVMFPATSTSALTFEVNQGDPVLCIFSQRCIDLFKASNTIELVNPYDLRKFDKRDAVAILGVFPFAAAPNNPNKRNWAHDTKDTVLVHNIGSGNEVEIRLKKDGRVIINSHKDVEVNCKKATVNASDSTVINSPLTVNGNTTVNGNITCSQTVTATTDVVGGGKSLATHAHTTISIGSPTSPPI